MAATFRIERSAVIQADAASLYDRVIDFRRWPEWSPYEGLDPDMKRTYSGTPKGRGAVYEWQGNRKSGTGRMEIVEAAEPHRIAIRLDFTKPFKASNRATFSFEPQGSATRVTWAMEGPQLLVSKLISIFVDIDKMVGRDFEKGLATLKSLAENPAE